MIAYILKANGLSLSGWNNTTTECKRGFIADYLRHLEPSLPSA